MPSLKIVIFLLRLMILTLQTKMTDVVYFDQGLGEVHFKYWSNLLFQFLMPKISEKEVQAKN